jgi:hypothetical protein
MQCFLIEWANLDRVSLRRFTTDGGKCHSAMTQIAIVDGDAPNMTGRLALEHTPASDPRWPTCCSCGCGRAFAESDEWQIFTEKIYRRVDGTPGDIHLREAPPGAMWDADWYHEWTTGSDGKSIIVVCPDGSQWFIDGPASNCTLPNDKEHRCWVRHGVPPMLTVDKNGKTCAAGGGSIAVKGYHGFLRSGRFT